MYKYTESPDFEILLFGYQDMQEWLNNLYDCINYYLRLKRQKTVKF